jgi:hypothetical protein
LQSEWNDGMMKNQNTGDRRQNEERSKEIPHSRSLRVARDTEISEKD